MNIKLVWPSVTTKTDDAMSWIAPLNTQGFRKVLRQPLDDDGVVVAPGVVGQVGLLVAGVDHEVEIPRSGDLGQSCARSVSRSWIIFWPILDLFLYTAYRILLLPRDKAKK